MCWIPSLFYFTFHLSSFDWHERTCTITCSTNPQCYAVYKGLSPELNILPVLSLSFPLSLSKSCNDKTAPMTTTPMCSSFYAKFLVSTVMGHHCPFSLSLLFGSTNLFTLRPCQCVYSCIVPHQTRSFPSLLLSLHFSCILILIRHNHIIHFIDVWTLGDLSLSFSLLTKTFGLIFISSLWCVWRVRHVFFTSSLTSFAMTGWPRTPDLKGTLSPTTTVGEQLFYEEISTAVMKFHPRSAKLNK